MSAFLTPGANPYAHLTGQLRNVPAPEFQGTWATIDIQPDSFAPQKYTVGVAVADLRGRVVFRLLDDFAKFECVYGKDDVAAIRSIVEHAEHALLRAQNGGKGLQDLLFDNDAVTVGEIWPTAGTSIDAVLHRLYFDVIPLIPGDQRKARDFVTLDNDAVRKLVDAELKRIAGLAFERVSVGRQRAIADAQTGQTHWLDFNLEPPRRAGSVISAVYKTPERVELNFLRASRDLSTFTRLRMLDGTPGIFIMTPAEDSMPAEDFARLDHILSEQSWNLEQQGFLVSAHDRPIDIAKDVWEWAKPSLANG